MMWWISKKFVIYTIQITFYQDPPPRWLYTSCSCLPLVLFYCQEWRMLLIILKSYLTRHTHTQAILCTAPSNILETISPNRMTNRNFTTRLWTNNNDVVVLWVVTPRSLVGGYQRFGRTYNLHLHGSTQKTAINTFTIMRTSNLNDTVDCGLLSCDNL
jgi:hypothetical protein